MRIISVGGNNFTKPTQRLTMSRVILEIPCQVWTQILVGVAYPVSEILLLSKTAKFPLLTMDYTMVIKKFNRLESAQKIHASRD